MAPVQPVKESNIFQIVGRFTFEDYITVSHAVIMSQKKENASE